MPTLPEEFTVKLPGPVIVLDEWKLVVVAEVPVAFTKVKFWRVEEAVERKPWRKPRVVEVDTP